MVEVPLSKHPFACSFSCLIISPFLGGLDNLYEVVYTRVVNTMGRNPQICCFLSPLAEGKAQT